MGNKWRKLPDFDIRSVPSSVKFEHCLTCSNIAPISSQKATCGGALEAITLGFELKSYLQREKKRQVEFYSIIPREISRMKPILVVSIGKV